MKINMNEDVEMDVDMPDNQPFHLVEDMDLFCMWKLLAKKLATYLDVFNNKTYCTKILNIGF